MVAMTDMVASRFPGSDIASRSQRQLPGPAPLSRVAPAHEISMMAGAMFHMAIPGGPRVEPPPRKPQQKPPPPPREIKKNPKNTRAPPPPGGFFASTAPSPKQ